MKMRPIQMIQSSASTSCRNRARGPGLARVGLAGLLFAALLALPGCAAILLTGAGVVADLSKVNGLRPLEAHEHGPQLASSSRMSVIV